MTLETLVIQSGIAFGDGAVSPLFADAWNVLTGFETDSGKPLRLVLWGSPEDDRIDLDLTNAVHRIAPADPHASKPDAIRSLLKEMAAPHEAVALVATADNWMLAAEACGVEVLCVDTAGTGRGNIDEWGEVPLAVAQRFFPAHLGNLRRGLEFMVRVVHGGELVSGPQAGAATIIAGAKIPIPLDDERLGNLRGVYVDLPVTVELPLDRVARARLSPQSEALAEAVHFVRGLQAAKRIQQIGDPEQRGTTHTVKIDGQGRKRLVRQRFS